MKKYLFDTNILFFLIKNEEKRAIFEAEFGVLGSPNHFVASVTLGELLSMVRRNGWSKKRVEDAEQMYKNFSQQGIDPREIQEAYAEIEMYNQLKHPNFRPADGQAKKMGKNDVWIAAAAKVLGAEVVTTDRKGFSHFIPEFLEVRLKSVSEYSGK